jgi:hypothetical protein
MTKRAVDNNESNAILTKKTPKKENIKRDKVKINYDQKIRIKYDTLLNNKNNHINRIVYIFKPRK